MKTAQTIILPNAGFSRRSLSVLFALILSTCACFGDWQRESNSLAWTGQGQCLWRFNYQPTNGKPYFEIIGQCGLPLTAVKPADESCFANWNTPADAARRPKFP